MDRSRKKKNLVIILIMFMVITAMNFALPQKAEAAGPTVKIGGVDISSYNDNKWHDYNDKKPTISGWKAGKYKLTKDKKTLYINGFKYSGKKRGITSTGALTIVFTGTNTFTCTGARGICLENSNEDRKNLTIGSGSTGTLNVNCTDAMAIAVNSFTMSTGTVKTTGKLDCEGNINVSGGTLSVTGNAQSCANVNISGGTTNISGNFYVYWYDDGKTGDFKGTGGTLTVGKSLEVGHNMTLSGANVTASTGGVLIQNDLTVSKGSLTGKDTSAEGTGIMVFGNTSISGTGKVSASANNADALSTSVLTVSGGTLEAVNKASQDADGGANCSILAENLKMSGGTIKSTANGNGGSAVYIEKSINISAGTVNATVANASNTWSALYCLGDLTATGGTISGTNSGKSSGLYVLHNLNLSGTAQISGSAKEYFGVIVIETATVSGGKLSGRSNTGTGLYSDAIEMKAGMIDTAGETGGIQVNKLNISGGTIQGEKTSEELWNDGVGIYGSFKMTGGKMTGKAAGGTGLAIYAPLDSMELAPDIGLSDPVDGYTSYHKDLDTDFFQIYDKNGDLAETATLQKVTSISVGTAPTAVLYIKDLFDPKGLVLNVSFEDGSTSKLSYNDNHKDMITFDIDVYQPLEPGDTVVGITCLSKTTSCTVNVRDLGTSVLSGTSFVNKQTLNWTAADGAHSYLLYGKKEDDSEFSLLTYTPETTYTNSRLDPGETWEYYVEPVRNSTSGNTVIGDGSAHIWLTTELNHPTISVSDSSYDSISLFWKEEPGADGYEVYRYSEGGPYVKLDYVTEPGFTDSGLVTGRTYKYYVRAAIPDKEVYSLPSNILTAVPEFTGTTTLEVKNIGKYELGWSATDGATGYEIWRGSGADGSRELLTTVDADTTSYTDESADIYSVYNYAIVPVRTSEEGAFSGTASNVAATEASTKPAPQIKPPKKDDPSGTVFNLLQARTGKVTKKSVQIKWKKVPGAKKYVIYGNKCGTKNKYVKLTTTTKTAITYKKVAGKKIAKGTYYKFIVYALDGKGKVISTSKTIHVATAGGKAGNDKAVKTAAKKNKVTLKKGKTFKLKAKAIPASKKLKVHRHRKIAYETTNKKVATVSAKGVIKAVGKGTCYVYAYTQNGIFVRIKVTVK